MNVEIHEQALQLQAALEKLLDRIGYGELSQRKTVLDQQVSSPNFWSDSQNAQQVSKEQAALSRRLADYQMLKKDIEDVVELSGLGDEKLSDDLYKQIQLVQE